MKKFLLLIITLIIGAEILFAQTAYIEKVWVDHNVVEDNQSGMRIHVKFNVYGLRNTVIQVSAPFYDATKKNRIKCYSQTRGINNFDLFTWEMRVFQFIRPTYDYSTYNDFPLFVPYEAFGSRLYEPSIDTCGTFNFQVEISTVYNAKTIATSKWYGFILYPKEQPLTTQPSDEWFRQASINYKDWQMAAVIKGDYIAQYHMGLCFEFGLNLGSPNEITKDMKMAISFYERSAAQNYEPAKKRLQKLKASNNLAAITFLSPTTSKSTIYNLKVGVNSSTQITYKYVSVNGSSRGLNVVNNNGYDLEINEFVTLNRGNNTINVSITNGSGTTTKSLNVYVTEENSTPTPIWSDKRVALVIGNSEYATAPLQNPVNDATDLAAKLKQLGFDVTLQTNLSHSGFETALKDFKDKVNNSDVALLFYAGHGMEINGKNYLIPIDAPIRDLDQLKYKSVDAYYALDILAGAKKKIVILDACRNNPATRDVMHGGLAAMNAKNAVIAYSTSPGMIALDGNGRNSPFSSALLNALDTKNLTLPQLFQKVGQFVNNTNPDQTPWYVSSLMEDVILNR